MDRLLLADPPPADARCSRLAGVVLGLFALGLALFHGRVGYMPLDQSIVYDGGWRIWNGQVPFRDFHAPNGLVPSVMQALMVGVFGPTWLAYVLHAALANAAFAVCSWIFLSTWRVSPLPAFVASIAAAVAFYPPMGVPYMDQHAFLFCMFALVLASRAIQRSGTPWAWLAVGACLGLAWLSKQTPTVFLALVPLGIAACARPTRGVRPWLWTVLGVAATVLVVLLCLLALGAERARLETYLFERPGVEGQARLRAFPSLFEFRLRLFGVGYELGLWSMDLALGLTLLLLASIARRLWRQPSGSSDLQRTLGQLLLGFGLLLCSFLHSSLTSNQPELSIPLIFAALALIQNAARSHFALTTLTGKRALWLPTLAAILPSAVTLRDAWLFERKVNMTRAACDVVVGSEPVEWARGELPKELRFMSWALPRVCTYTAGDFGALVRFLREREEPMFLLSDASVLYALCGKQSMAPSLWFHPGLTMPRAQETDFPAYERQLLANLGERPFLVVSEGERTWIGCKLADFRELSALIEARGTELAQFGPFRVVRVEGP